MDGDSTSAEADLNEAFERAGRLSFAEGQALAVELLALVKDDPEIAREAVERWEAMGASGRAALVRSDWGILES